MRPYGADESGARGFRVAPGRLPGVLGLIEAARDRASGPRPAVVVSALGDSTDDLYLAISHAARKDDAGAAAEFAKVRALALHIGETVLDAGALAEFGREVGAVLDPLSGRLAAAAGEISADLAFEVVAAGERISAALVAAALRARGGKSRAVDARDFMVADKADGAAIAWPETVRAFAPVLAVWGEDIPVVTGFIARARDGRTVTLGRNGSD